MNIGIIFAFVFIVMYFATVWILFALLLRNNEKPKAKDISYEEVVKLIEDFQFWETVKEVAEGKGCDKIPMTDSGYIAVLQPCEHRNCSCHESREDCCNTRVEIDGQDYCRVLININKLCGLPEAKEVPDVRQLLTNEECELLANKLIEFMEEKENEKK